MAPAVLAALVAGGGGLLRGLLGQRAANKQSDASRAEAERVARDRYNREKANYDAALARRKSTLDFAKSISKAHGYSIPDSAFDFLMNQQYPEFPAFNAPMGDYKPNPLLSGLAGAGAGAADAYSTSTMMSNLNRQFGAVGLPPPTARRPSTPGTW